MILRMKKLYFLLLALFATLQVFADSQGDKALADLSQRLKDLGSYHSDIEVQTKGSLVKGTYEVRGDDFHIDLGSVEYWGEGDRRYEVTHKIKEIVVEQMDNSNKMILNNPTKAFDFVADDFDVVVHQGFVITLTPKNREKGLEIDRVTIALDSKSLLPRNIVYEAEGDRAIVEFKSLKASKSSFKSIDLGKYKDYDIVDLY